MTDITIRRLAGDAMLEAMYSLTSYALHASPPLTDQRLAALVYGTHDPGDFAVRGWGDPSPAVQAAMRALFPPQIPYLHERF
jgi:hypothetical protein